MVQLQYHLSWLTGILSIEFQRIMTRPSTYCSHSQSSKRIYKECRVCVCILLICHILHASTCTPIPLSKRQESVTVFVKAHADRPRVNPPQAETSEPAVTKGKRPRSRKSSQTPQARYQEALDNHGTKDNRAKSQAVSACLQSKEKEKKTPSSL